VPLFGKSQNFLLFVHILRDFSEAQRWRCPAGSMRREAAF
jgi:hypothetical protein